MSAEIASLEPKAMWGHFAALSAVPRASKKEEKVIAFMLEFGARLGLETQRDATGNVLIRKPATPGMEDRMPVVLQAHLDMVCQKNADTVFDFDTEGIRLYVDGDWVRARGTTLGADNGLGVAAIMAVLEAKDLAHPPLEALFTVDEETGMTGAKELAPDWLRGRMMLNLDTEEDHVLSVGCAGGVDLTARGAYLPEPLQGNFQGLYLQVRGLQGGHSGMDIHKGLGNANKMMGRLLAAAAAAKPVRLSRLEGGNLRNAIPRECEAVLAYEPDQLASLEAAIQAEAAAIQAEFAPVEPDMQVRWETCPAPVEALPREAQEKFIHVLCAALSGVQYMSYQFPEQTETSNNLAQVTAKEGQIRIGCLTRSSSETRKAALVRSLEGVFRLAGYQTETSGAYPGWSPDPSSAALALLQERYRARFGSDPETEAGHGGLECGLIKAHYPQMDMISFGPTILGAHSPDERASVSSSQKFWGYLEDVLAHIPKA